MSWLLGAFSDRRTYGSLVYSLLGLPIGIFGFTVVVTSFALGLGLVITLLGIPVLVATLILVRAMATMERRLAWSLLDASMPRRPPMRPSSYGSFWQHLLDLFSARQTWREIGFILLRLPLGIVGFTIAIALIGLMFGGFAMPILVAVGVESQIGSWIIDTIPESFFYLPISFLFLLVGPRILLGWGQVSGRTATSFLGVVDNREMKRAVTETLVRTGEADAFSILSEMELRLGRVPSVNSTRAEATLLALESTGQVQAHREGSTTMYRLRDDKPLGQK
ncbi:MAG TPA: sensor domain-containing protein [Acidimicrobiia bacterium]|nr:sensor domain-containing protein [Acidimicrobiia bacterium]